MNAMSSRAKTFVGSAIATASELPIFRTGMTSYFLAVGAGTRRRTVGSISSWASVIEGTPYWRGRDPSSRFSVVEPRVESEEDKSELQSPPKHVCRRLLRKKKQYH